MANARWTTLILCTLLARMVDAAAPATQPATAAAVGVTFESLLDEMSNLSALAQESVPRFTTKQFSSYDRASDGRRDWFANHDRGQFIRAERRGGRTEHVMMDARGPGAIVRMWSANPKGTLRVYLDGSDQPIIEGPTEQVLTGATLGVGEPFGGIRAKGYNLYLPFPYATSCKVTCDADDIYYLINYRAFDPATRVETFAPGQLDASRAHVRRVGEQLTKPRGAVPAPAQEKQFSIEVPAGGTAVLGTLEGEGAITRFLVNVKPDDPAVEAMLRNLVLEMTFDGQQTVQAPLGDFFGTATGINPFESLPLGMTRQGELWSHWIMPFQRSAQVRVRNLGSAPTTLAGVIGSSPRAWSEGSFHFHAGYRAQYDIPTRPFQDWKVLETSGAGKFVGMALTIDNPTKRWWGEGDEKIFVDGENFPSWFGTGTEDYFGYAWSAPDRFWHAYHNQPRCDGPLTYGRSSLNRFHIMDVIPFERSLRFDLELWHWKDCRVNMASVAYWYARPGSTDAFARVEAKDVVIAPIAPYVTQRVAGALEGEEMTVVAPERGVEPQTLDVTSNEEHLWWREGAQPGKTMTVTFNAPEAGRQRVLARFVKSWNYGTVQVSINGAKAGGPLDLFSDPLQLSDEIDLGVHALKAGANTLDVTVVAANPRSRAERYMVGLDYLRLEPAPQ